MQRVWLIAGLALILGGCITSKPGAHGAPSPAAVTAHQAPEPLDSQALMIDSAVAMLGQPYRYGGAAPGGFDCSGLVVYAADSAGIRLPRTAQEQLRAGVPVRRRAIKPGDLVFMHLAHKELHVGISLDADRFIHAPSTGGFVRIDSLAAPPYSTAFIGARRVIGAASEPAP
ncbi:MAG TPA: C40 family peptidase [Steroidobacteraceae bacterium]|nr:C40 family peptidase [Steroidobacteraceae bacterium]